MESSSVRGGMAGSTGHYIAVAIRKRAERDRAAMTGMAAMRDHVSQLELLADYADRLPVSDPVLCGIAFVQSYLGKATHLSYAPDREQDRLLQLVGTTPGRPSPDKLLAELLAAGVEDVQKFHAVRHEELRQKHEKEKIRADQLEPIAQKANDLEGQLGAANARVDQLTADVAAERSRLNYFRETEQRAQDAEGELRTANTRISELEAQTTIESEPVNA